MVTGTKSYGTDYSCFAAGAHNSSRRARSRAAGHGRLTPLPAVGPPTAALPSTPPSPSGLNSSPPATAPTVLETGDHSPVRYCLSMTRVCPLLGFTSKKSTTPCHAAEPALPQLLDTPENDLRRICGKVPQSDSARDRISKSRWKCF